MKSGPRRNFAAGRGSRCARRNARRAVSDQPAALQPGSPQRVHRGHPAGGRARGAQRLLGDDRKFELYNASTLRASIESREGRSVTLPDLADRVGDDLYTQRVSLCAAAKSLPIGNRAELGRWRGEVSKVLAAAGLNADGTCSRPLEDGQRTALR